jgi:hypothetical protein
VNTSSRGIPAADLIAEHLAACQPPAETPIYRAIKHALYVGFGPKRVAMAELEMFDGQAATIEVYAWGVDCLAHRWTRLDGGFIACEGGRWVRRRG